MYGDLLSSVMDIMIAKSPNEPFHWNKGSAMHVLHSRDICEAVIWLDLPIETVDVGFYIEEASVILGRNPTQMVVIFRDSDLFILIACGGESSYLQGACYYYCPSNHYPPIEKVP